MDALALGESVPIPTAPLLAISIELVGAPGRILKGNLLPVVTSLIKKFVSFPATSQR